MTVHLPLTHEEETKLRSIAEGRGLSTDALVKCAVIDILKEDAPAANGEAPVEDPEKRLQELFAAFDRASAQAVIREETFHRENWYR